MKILHIGKYFPPFNGGLENYMHDAMVALSRRGIHSAALVHSHSFRLKTTSETLKADGIKLPVVRTGMWARFLFTPISPGFGWQLRSLIRSYQPDILHLHMPNPSVFWALLLPSARRIPWVVHWHSDVITSNQSGLMKLFYRLYRPFERAVLRRAETIVATSQPYLESSEPLQPWTTKCCVVPLGVDTSKYEGLNAASSEDSPSSGPLKVLAVGRLTYYKGFRYLIEAIASLKNVHVDIVGDGEEAVKLKSLASSLQSANRVSFHGSLSDHELADLMRNADCVCLPSIERTEAFGMVLLEAMFFGKATVVSDVPGSGMGWIVDEGQTGLKIKPADAQELINALAWLDSNREELKKMGQRGKQKFSRQFEISQSIQGLLDVYQRIIPTHTSADSGFSH